MYSFRCTEQQLNDSLAQIHEAGDTLLHAVYKGGRDWVLICRKAVDRNARLQQEAIAAVEAGRFAPGGDLA